MILSGCGSEQKAQTGAVVENAMSGSRVQATRAKAYGSTVNEVSRDAKGRIRNSLKEVARTNISMHEFVGIYITIECIAVQIVDVIGNGQCVMPGRERV